MFLVDLRQDDNRCQGCFEKEGEFVIERTTSFSGKELCSQAEGEESHVLRSDDD